MEFIVLSAVGFAIATFMGKYIGFEEGRRIGWEEMRDGKIYWNEKHGFQEYKL